MYSSYVIINDVKLDKSIKIKNGKIRLLIILVIFFRHFNDISLESNTNVSIEFLLTILNICFKDNLQRSYKFTVRQHILILLKKSLVSLNNIPSLSEI